MNRRLVAAVRARVRLNIAGPDGVTQRDKLKRELENSLRGGFDAPEIRERLQEPPIPKAGALLWDWFWQLAAIAGAEAVTYRDVAAWRDLAGVKILPVEVSILLSMDQARLDVAHSARSGANQQGMTPATSHNLLSAAKAMGARLVTDWKKPKPAS